MVLDDHETVILKTDFDLPALPKLAPSADLAPSLDKEQAARRKPLTKPWLGLRLLQACAHGGACACLDTTDPTAADRDDIDAPEQILADLRERIPSLYYLRHVASVALQLEAPLRWT